MLLGLKLMLLNIRWLLVVRFFRLGMCWVILLILLVVVLSCRFICW